jgi:hypothetical protein
MKIDRVRLWVRVGVAVGVAFVARSAAVLIVDAGRVNGFWTHVPEGLFDGELVRRAVPAEATPEEGGAPAIWEATDVRSSWWEAVDAPPAEVRFVVEGLGVDGAAAVGEVGGPRVHGAGGSGVEGDPTSVSMAMVGTGEEAGAWTQDRRADVRGREAVVISGDRPVLEEDGSVRGGWYLTTVMPVPEPGVGVMLGLGGLWVVARTGRARWGDVRRSG